MIPNKDELTTKLSINIVGLLDIELSVIMIIRFLYILDIQLE